MSAFSEAVKALPNLGLYWTLDDVTGVTDQSGNGRNGSGQGSITIGGHEASPVLGHSHATDFDGSDDHVTSSYEPWANGTTRTVGGWFWSDTSARVQDLWCSNSGNVVYTPRIHTDSGGGGNQANGLYFSPNWATTDTQWSGALPGTGQWIFLVISFNEATNAVTAYINGEALEAKTNAGQYTAGKKFQIGRSASGSSQEFDGKMAHVFVVEGALTAETVADLYEAATVSEPPAEESGPSVGSRSMMGVGR